MSIGEKSLFKGEDAAFVSGLLRKDGWLLDIAGKAELLFGTGGVSWVDGRRFTLPSQFENDRILIQP